DLLDEILGGMFAVPLNLGRFSAHGRAVLARKKMCDMTAEIMASPNLSQQNIIADLMQETVDGKGFSKEEVLDTVLTLLLAGKLTTADALPSLLVDLHQHRSWVDKIAAEPLESFAWGRFPSCHTWSKESLWGGRDGNKESGLGG
ncbi:unnamed protein product, partial [Effrenium voratum]